MIESHEMVIKINLCLIFLIYIKKIGLKRKKSRFESKKTLFSDSLSFELAAKLAFKTAAKAAKAVIMEPIMKLEVITPEENMGDIVGDLNRRRGQVNSMDDRAGAKVVKGEVPLSEMFGYVTSLRTLSSGRATSTMEFSHYAETPTNISETVISEVKGNTTE